MSPLSKQTKPILIAGPTASGKSALALRLAEHCGGTIINADSMQVYAELNVLSARPSRQDEARVPHALYGHVPAREAYSAGRFVADAAAAIATAQRDGLRPIIVGGTGLYFKALLEGLSPVPPISDDVRQHWRAMEKEHGAYALYVALWDDDPEMAARLDPNDGQRIVRALEVVHSTGQSLAAWQRTPGQPILRDDETVRLVVLPERTALNEACDRRFDQMMADGGLREAEALAALNLAPDLPAMRALGVRPLIAAVHKTMLLEDAVGQAKAETRQYAKRQMTWLRRNMLAWDNTITQEYESNLVEIFSFIQS